MIGYDLIVPSASRPHLLKPVLETLLAQVDQDPVRILIHNDERFPGKRQAIEDVIHDVVPAKFPVVLGHDDPPIRHGPALKWLLDRVTTEYVLYTQDDHRVKRPLPIKAALQLLHEHELNQIRFNKRDTLDKKGREGEEFYKQEFWFPCPGLSERWHYPRPTQALDIALLANDPTPYAPCLCERDQPCARHRPPEGPLVPLCAADHWYFQTGVWRVAAIKPVVDWWARPDAPGAFTEHCEVKINDVFNGKYPTVAFPDSVPRCEPAMWNVPIVRAAIHRTFIWGRVGEPAFVEHIGHLPEDWALERANRDPDTRQV